MKTQADTHIPGLPALLPHPRALAGNYLQLAIFLGAVGISFYICYRLALPFLTPLTVAFVLAVLFAPLHRRIETRFKRAGAAASLTVFIVAGFSLVLATLIVAQLIREAAAGAILVRTAIDDGLITRILAEHPKIAPFLQSALHYIDLQGLAGDAASWITNVSGSLLRGWVLQTAGALLTFYLLYYFLRDRRIAIASLRSFLPFTDSETDMIFARIVDTVYATVYGMVVTGTILGILGGSIFAAVGLPAPLLWGLVMAVFAILPVLGIGMIWIPAVVILALEGEWIQAFGVAIAFTIVTIADTAIYPALVGNRLKLHTALALLAAIGGLIVFGPAGFILGPIAVAVALTLKDILMARALAASKD